MAATLLPVVRATFRDPVTDLPLAGGKVYTYDAGTTNDKDTYTTSVVDPMSANTNPVILDAAGQADIWLDGYYHIVVTDANDVQFFDTDNVSQGNLVFDASTTVAGKMRFATVPEQVAGVISTAASTPQGVAAQTRFDLLIDDAKTAMVNDDYFAIVDSEDSNNNAVISYSDLLTQLATALNTGGDSPAGAPSVFSGVIVDAAYDDYSSQTQITAVIPLDNTIPQRGEGLNIMTASITPKKVTNRIRARFTGVHNPSTNSTSMATMFVTGSDNAVRSCVMQSGNNNINMQNSLVMEFEYVPGVLTEVTVQVNAGTAGGTARMNTARGFTLGNTMAATLILEEIDPDADASGQSSIKGFTFPIMADAATRAVALVHVGGTQTPDGSTTGLNVCRSYAPGSGIISAIKVWNASRSQTSSEADNTLTFFIGNTAITGGVITLPGSGSIAQTTFSCSPSGAKTVAQNDLLGVVWGSPTQGTTIAGLITVQFE